MWICINRSILRNDSIKSPLRNNSDITEHDPVLCTVRSIRNRSTWSAGGTVMASLGLITGVLGFDETGTALMLTIFALQDSFGTACNVTGDGALTLILTGFAEKHGIKKQTQTVEL